ELHMREFASQLDQCSAMRRMVLVFRCRDGWRRRGARPASRGPDGSRDQDAPKEALQEIGVRLDATSVRYALNAGTNPDSAPSATIAIGVSQRAGSSFNASSTTPVCARTM